MFCVYISRLISTPWTADVNLTYFRSPNNVQDVLWTFYLRSVYNLCSRGSLREQIMLVTSPCVHSPGMLLCKESSPNLSMIVLNKKVPKKVKKFLSFINRYLLLWRPYSIHIDFCLERFSLTLLNSAVRLLSKKT